MIPAYSADDIVGKDYQCRCVIKGQKHPYCENCLILIGPSHVEQVQMAALLPIYEDHFDDEQGCWLRGVHDRPCYVCQSCDEELTQGRYVPTLRIGRKQPRPLREARDRAWRAQHPTASPLTHVGEFVRVGQYHP